MNESSDCDEVNARGSVQQSLTANDDCSSVSLESESITATHSESSHEVEVKARSERRALINEKLKNHKQEKLKRKLPLDSQLLSIAQDEMKVKKQLLDKLDSMDQQYSDTMKSLPSFWKRCVFGVHTDTDAVAFSKRSTFNSVFKRIRFR